MSLSPLKTFFIAAVLWLPMCFFLWFYFAGVVVWPVGHVAEWLLVSMFPDAISGIEQTRFEFEVQTRLLANPMVTGGRIGLYDLQINPMVYGYGLPLFSALTMATPMAAMRRAWLIALGYLVISAVTLWGVFWNALKIFRYDLGADGALVLDGTIFIEPVVGLSYQFGYLILPAVTPIALWIVCNSAFLDLLVGDKFRFGTVRQASGHSKAPETKANEHE